jgi:hypothetical protein
MPPSPERAKESVIADDKSDNVVFAHDASISVPDVTGLPAGSE